jgi:hypothetical protein
VIESACDSASALSTSAVAITQHQIHRESRCAFLGLRLKSYRKFQFLRLSSRFIKDTRGSSFLCNPPVWRPSYAEIKRVVSRGYSAGRMMGNRDLLQRYGLRAIRYGVTVKSDSGGSSPESVRRLESRFMGLEL